MNSAGGARPSSDITGRMEISGRLFGERIGVSEPTRLATPRSVVAAVRSRIPRAADAEDDQVFEAAAFVGEWLRGRAHAAWVAEGPFEPHLQLVDPTHAIVYLLPLVQLVRTASTAGYDGMTAMIERVLADVTEPADDGPIEAIRVEPSEDREDVVEWIRTHRDAGPATRAALWRRCSICSNIEERMLALQQPGADWEEEAATAASVLSATPFECPCGGPPGAVTRFLMVRHEGEATRFGDIYVANTHTRVGCWTIADDRAIPFDALDLTRDDALTG